MKVRVNVFPAEKTNHSKENGYVAVAEGMEAMWEYADTLDEVVKKFKHNYGAFFSNMQFKGGETVEFDYRFVLD